MEELEKLIKSQTTLLDVVAENIKKVEQNNNYTHKIIDLLAQENIRCLRKIEKLNIKVAVLSGAIWVLCLLIILLKN